MLYFEYCVVLLAWTALGDLGLLDQKKKGFYLQIL